MWWGKNKPLSNTVGSLHSIQLSWWKFDGWNFIKYAPQQNNVWSSSKDILESQWISMFKPIKPNFFHLIKFFVSYSVKLNTNRKRHSFDLSVSNAFWHKENNFLWSQALIDTYIFFMVDLSSKLAIVEPILTAQNWWLNWYQTRAVLWIREKKNQSIACMQHERLSYLRNDTFEWETSEF